MVPHFGKQPKKYNADCGNTTPNVVTKPRSGGAQQSGEQRRQVHCKEPKRPLAKADQRKPAKQCLMIPRNIVGAEHCEEIQQEDDRNTRAVSEVASDPSGKEIAGN